MLRRSVRRSPVRPCGDQAQAKRCGRRTREGRTGCHATAGRYRKAERPVAAERLERLLLIARHLRGGIVASAYAYRTKRSNPWPHRPDLAERHFTLATEKRPHMAHSDLDNEGGHLRCRSISRGRAGAMHGGRRSMIPEPPRPNFHKVLHIRASGDINLISINLLILVGVT